jgi:hypothetical protein
LIDGSGQRISRSLIGRFVQSEHAQCLPRPNCGEPSEAQQGCKIEVIETQIVLLTSLRQFFFRSLLCSSYNVAEDRLLRSSSPPNSTSSPQPSTNWRVNNHQEHRDISLICRWLLVRHAVSASSTGSEPSIRRLLMDVRLAGKHCSNFAALSPN